MTNTTTVRGTAKQGYRLAKSIEKADTMNFSIGGKNAMLNDVEVTGVVNSHSGGLEVVMLKNYTNGTEWKFSRSRAVFGF